jgi:hypothetical protein
MGCTSRTLVGTVGSFEVVGVRVGLGMGGGGLLRVTAHSTLGDGLLVGALVSGVAGNRGRSTLGDGVLVVGGGDEFCWSVGRRILRSCWMACACTMASLVEDGTVPPRAVSVSVAWMIIRSASEIVGVAQCVG